MHAHFDDLWKVVERHVVASQCFWSQWHSTIVYPTRALRGCNTTTPNHHPDLVVVLGAVVRLRIRWCLHIIQLIVFDCVQLTNAVLA